jgi:branched-chain amino acid transport system substrate-binding protein
LAVLVIALVGTILASSSLASRSAGTYNLVAITSLTGASAPSDVGYLSGAQAAFDAVNASGGVDGQQIKLHVLDDQSSPTQSVAVARQALSENPTAIVDLGDISSRDPVYGSNKVPVMAVGQFSFLPYVYSSALTFPQAVHADVAGLEAALGVKSLKGKKIALFGPEASAYHFLAGALTKGIQADGGTVVTSVFQPFGSPSFSAGAAQIVGAKPDAVMGNDTSANIVVEARGLNSAGFKAPIVIDYAATDQKTLQTINLPNMFGEGIYAPPVAGTTEYNTAKKFHLGDASTTAGANFGLGWALAYSLVAGLKKCGPNCSQEALITALNGLGSYTVPGNMQLGPLVLTAKIHEALTHFQLYRWDAKQKKIVKYGSPVSLGPSA